MTVLALCFFSLAFAAFGLVARTLHSSHPVGVFTRACPRPASTIAVEETIARDTTHRRTDALNSQTQTARARLPPSPPPARPRPAADHDRREEQLGNAQVLPLR